MASSPVYLHRRLLSSMSEIIGYCEELQVEANRQGHHFLTGNLQRIMAVARRAVEYTDRLCAETDSLLSPSMSELHPRIEGDDGSQDLGTPAQTSLPTAETSLPTTQTELPAVQVDGLPTGITDLKDIFTPGLESCPVVTASPAEMEDFDFPTGSIHLPSMAPELLALAGGEAEDEQQELSQHFLDFFDNPLQGRRGGGAPDAGGDATDGDGSSKEDDKVKQVGSVLVVDDNVVDRNMLARKLFGNGFAVCTAEGGYQALETLASTAFDVVVLDLFMADMDGFAVIQRIRQKRSATELPIIALTAQRSQEDGLEALAVGANDFAPKKSADGGVILARTKTQMALKKAADCVGDLSELLDGAGRTLTRLMETSPDSYDEVYAWARSLAYEFSQRVEIPDMGVWVVDRDQQLQLVAGTEEVRPSSDDLDRVVRTCQSSERDGVRIIPACGLGRDMFGVVVVPDATATAGPLREQLLSIFAQRLGSALELKHVRDALGTTERVVGPGSSDAGTGGETEFDMLRVCPECGRCYDQSASHCGADGHLLDTSRPLAYHLAGRYRLTRILGEGAMGTVFQAVDRRLARQVAVKVINPSHFGETSVRKRFVREARSVARISHPNIISVFDCGNLKSGTVYIVMERLHGSDLGQLIDNIGLGSPAEVATLLRQSGSALQAAHRGRLLHRDIKPENIFLIPDDGAFQVKVVDFGLAKNLGGGDGGQSMDADVTQTEQFETKVGTVLGTPLFMPPEQAMGKQVDARGDIYSLAAVAYFALTGHLLSSSQMIVRVLLDVLQNKPASVSSILGEDVPSSVDEAFEVALAKDPEDRPSDILQWVNSFVDDLASVPPAVPGWFDEQGRLRM
jgi:CheY-like chemotaxis protein